MRRVPSKQKNTLVKRELDPRSLTRLALLLLCGLLLATGFVFTPAVVTFPRCVRVMKPRSCATRSIRSARSSAA